MIFTYFRTTAGEDASGLANGGQGKLALVPSTIVPPIMVPSSASTSAESVLLEHIISSIQAVQPRFSRALITQYYVALKTYPLVFLASNDSQTAAELMQLFAAALIGTESRQCLHIGAAGWLESTGQDHYFRTVQERFSALRLQDLLQEAGDATNVGKAFFLCFEMLAPAMLNQLLSPTGLLSTLPDNLAASAVLAPDDIPVALSMIRGAGVVVVPSLSGITHATVVAPPPVGLQRLWLQARMRDQSMQRSRVTALLESETRPRLPALDGILRMLWRGGMRSALSHDIMNFLASSFDNEGYGLFDSSDVWQNMVMAVETHIQTRIHLAEGGVAAKVLYATDEPHNDTPTRTAA